MKMIQNHTHKWKLILKGQQQDVIKCKVMDISDYYWKTYICMKNSYTIKLAYNCNVLHNSEE